MKTKIVIVDDHASIREMLVWILLRDADFEIIGEAGSGLDAIRLCAKSQPDLVILDLILPCLSGTEVMRRVRKESPYTKVLIYSGACEGYAMREAMCERPQGYVHKSEGFKILRQAMANVIAGSNYYSTEAQRYLHDTPGLQPPALSVREREVLQLIAEGRSSKQISSLLNVALKTVDNHRANIMDKLDMHDVASLTRYAVGRGMVSVEWSSGL
jgi:DNA-binding NarL/FixJ family response regulator